jgi:DNA repair protein RadA/Sms
MAKVKHVFVCRSCGGVQARWMGKCPDCGRWDSLEDSTLDPAGEKDPQRGLVAAWSELEDKIAAGSPATSALPIEQVGADASPLARVTSGIGEFDRVLGGGMVPGSVVLLGGEPGIGKSTLLLQAAATWAGRDVRVLYVSSEESAEQIKMRFERLASKDGAGGASGTRQRSVETSLFLLADTNLARIVEQTRRVMPRVLIIDSIQMIYKADLPASPGSVTQLRRCCAELVYLAKASGIAIALVGHVTKEGTLAGPRLLEHLVDAVLSFEGDRYHSHRVVRAIKNRFGTTLEIGLFEMTGHGLSPVPDGAGLHGVLGDPRPGSVVCPVMTGTRCVLVELQALTATGFLGAAKRKCSGLDANRLAMLIAVLEQHAGLRLADRDIFASSVGGLRVAEPATDLALLLAIAGAHSRRSLPPATLAVGEVGLGGEVRPVPHLEQRLHEAARLGYKHILVPRRAGKHATSVAGIEKIEVKNVDAAIQHLR